MIKEGIININKPKEYTSHDCVNVIRSLTGIKRVGHTGTLDPMAEGVLPICIGSAARITEYLDLDFKVYSCDILLGIETDTLDIWGKTICDNTAKTVELIERGDITQEMIVNCLKEFDGTISQIPPKYSALKVNGRKLYDYARAGEAVEIASRNVYVRDIKIITQALAERTFTFEVTCSKGTYIRSICRDIGEMLGCGAAMSGLVRLKSGMFDIKNAVDIETLKKLKQGEDIRNPETGRIVTYARALPQDINSYILDTDFPLGHFGKAFLSDDRAEWFCNGGFVDENQMSVEKEPEYKEKQAHIKMRSEFKNAYNVYKRSAGQEIFLGVAFFDQETKKLKADKIFAR